MKKLLSFISAAAVILFSANTLAAAETIIDQDSESSVGTINVEYSADDEYTVVIPSGVTFTDTEKTAERGIEARNVILSPGSSLYVAVSSQNNFRMKNGDSYIDYRLQVNGNPSPDAGSYNVMVVAHGEKTGWALLTFSTDLNKDNAFSAGNYSDILTFTVSVS